MLKSHGNCMGLGIRYGASSLYHLQLNMVSQQHKASPWTESRCMAQTLDFYTNEMAYSDYIKIAYMCGNRCFSDDFGPGGILRLRLPSINTVVSRTISTKTWLAIVGWLLPMCGLSTCFSSVAHAKYFRKFLFLSICHSRLLSLLLLAIVVVLFYVSL